MGKRSAPSFPNTACPRWGKSSRSAAAAASPHTPVCLYDAANLPAADVQEPGWPGSSSEFDQNKRKRNGSFDSFEGFDFSQVDQEVICSPSLSTETCRRPGRKPLTESGFDDDDEDPKAKRKVQNRAAQRAFRERKERYVRDLEMKIRQLQNAHIQQTTQLSQENQYLRSIIQQLKSELCVIKGLPSDNYTDVLPTISPWQQSLPPSSDLAPFLTMGSHPPLTPAVIAPAPPRPRQVAIAPACTPPPAAASPQAAKRTLAKKRPVAILPQKQDSKPTNSNHQQSALFLSDTNNATTSSSSSSSHPALYVQFSPRMEAQNGFVRQNTIVSTEPYLTSESMFTGNDPVLYSSNSNSQCRANSPCGSSSGSRGSRSPSAPARAPITKDTTEKAAAVEVESDTTRIQTVWRRLNLYGRFTDFNFDQLCRVAQMADHSNGPPLATSDGRVPLMEDWELDKLMHTIDPDHL